jgi:hypothetical protein
MYLYELIDTCENKTSNSMIKVSICEKKNYIEIDEKFLGSGTF